MSPGSKVDDSINEEHAINKNNNQSDQSVTNQEDIEDLLHGEWLFVRHKNRKQNQHNISLNTRNITGQSLASVKKDMKQPFNGLAGDKSTVGYQGTKLSVRGLSNLQT